jgi:hypothetical protein
MEFINNYEQFLIEAKKNSVPKPKNMPDSLQHGELVYVFRNLNTSKVMNDWDKMYYEHGLEIDHNGKNGDVIWSIRDQDGITVYHSYNVRLENVSFLVRQGRFDDNGIGRSNRAQVLTTGQKNIHSFVVGNIVEWDDPMVRKPKTFDIDTKTVEVMEKGAMGWVGAYYKPTELDRYVVPNTEQYRQLGIAGRELLKAEECVMGQVQFGQAVFPFVYVLNPTFTDFQQPLNDDGKFPTVGVTPKKRPLGKYTGKYKVKNLIDTIDTDAEEDILGEIIDAQIAKGKQ